MTWEEYYDKFYDWAESTQINKLSSVEKLGPGNEVAEVIQEFYFNHPEASNRLARKAAEQRVIFSGEDLADLTGIIEEDLQNQLVEHSSEALTEKDLEQMLGCIDDDIMARLYKSKGYKIPADWAFIDDSDEAEEEVPLEADYVEIEQESYDEFYDGKGPSGFFSKLAMGFAIGEGIRLGIKDATEKDPDKKKDWWKL